MKCHNAWLSKHTFSSGTQNSKKITFFYMYPITAKMTVEPWQHCVYGMNHELLNKECDEPKANPMLP